MYSAIVNQGNPHPVVIYGRVSQLRDDRSKSVDDQLDDLRGWADREGWPVVAEHRDDGVSASRFAKGKARPGWEQVLDVVASGKVRALLVWELSRASRDKAVTAALEVACIRAGVRIGYGFTLHDPATSAGEFDIGLQGLLAARQSAETSEKVQRSVQSRAARGAPHSALPFGYRRVLSPATGQTIAWEPHPTNGPIVQEVCARLLAGESSNAIANSLNKRGIPPVRGRKWYANSVTLLAKRPALAGLRVANGRIQDVRGTWPPLISEADHHRLVAKFADPDRPRHPKHVALLGVGLFRCGKAGCTGRLMGWSGKGRPPAYRCRACGGAFIAREPTDLLVERVAVEFLSRPDVLAELAADDEGAEQAGLEVARLERKAAELEQALDDDAITVAQFTRLSAATATRLADAERRARPRGVPSAVLAVAGAHAPEKWRVTSITNKRVILDALFEVVIRPGRIGTKGFDPSRVEIGRR